MLDCFLTVALLCFTLIHNLDLNFLSRILFPVQVILVQDLGTKGSQESRAPT